MFIILNVTQLVGYWLGFTNAKISDIMMVVSEDPIIDIRFFYIRLYSSTAKCHSYLIGNVQNMGFN